MSEAAAVATPTEAQEDKVGAPSEFELAYSKAIQADKDKVVPDPVKPKDEPKPEAAKTEAIPEVKAPEAKTPDLENPVGMSPTASQKFNAIKQSREEWKGKAAEYEGKIKELTEQIEKAKTAPKAPVDDSEMKALKEEHAKMSDELKRLGVERHPRFKAHFNAKEETVLGVAKSAVGAGKAAHVEALLKQAPSEYRTQRLEELAEDLSSLGQARLSRAIDDWDTVQKERSDAITTESAKWEQTQAEEKAAQQGQIDGIKTKFEGLAKLALEGAVNYDSFKEIDGDSEHNAKVANNKAFVKKFMSGTLKEEVFAFTPVLAAEALHLREKVIPSMQAEIAKRDKIIADLQAATPSVDIKGGDKKETTPEDEDFITMYQKARAQ